MVRDFLLVREPSMRSDYAFVYGQNVAFTGLTPDNAGGGCGAKCGRAIARNYLVQIQRAASSALPD